MRPRAYKQTLVFKSLVTAVTEESSILSLCCLLIESPCTLLETKAHPVTLAHENVLTRDRMSQVRVLTINCPVIAVP